MACSTYLELRCSPSLELVSSVRRFVEDFFSRLFRDREMTSRVAIATHELLENAAKYSRGGETSLCVEVSEAGAFCVCTRNRATRENVAKVGAYVEEMQAAGDPFDYYQK